jgi:hypothetical protein
VLVDPEVALLLEFASFEIPFPLFPDVFPMVEALLFGEVRPFSAREPVT